MAEPAAKASMTAEDLFLISSDQASYELTAAGLIRTPPAGGLHGWLAARLARALLEHAEARGLGMVCGAETGFILQRQPDIVRAPDVSFIARERIPSTGPPEAYWPFAPDLAVEVVSPTDRVGELQAKIEDYFAGGTTLVWVVHPRTRNVFVYHSPADVSVVTEAQDLSGENVLPGFTLPLSRLFR